MIRQMRWQAFGIRTSGMKAGPFEEGRRFEIKEIYEGKNMQLITVVSFFETLYDLEGGSGEVLRSKTIESDLKFHSAIFFNDKECRKLGLRVFARGTLKAKDIESVLSMSDDELKRLHRGSLNGRKFGL